jgi:hypothetical protein
VSVRPTSPDRLYELLPALYRIADVENNEELRALLRLINRQADDLRGNVHQLWDDFFIETCQRWVVPYIGDLVGNIPLHELDLSSAAATAESLFTDLTGPDLRPPAAIRTRADVAKTIYYRRRKGTPQALEELARDVTGWDSRVVEFFHLLDWNQHLEHLQPERHGCPTIRAVDAGDRVGGPWDDSSHTVDVRRINEWDGWYGIPNLGFFLWRLIAYPHTQVEPRKIGGSSWRRTFSPLGQDVPLFSAGDGDPSASGRSTEQTVDGPIRPAAFFSDLETVPDAPPATPASAFYGPKTEGKGSARLIVFANGVPVPANLVSCVNLEGWSTFAQPAGNRIGIDVKHGRFVVGSGRPANEVITVSYCAGFSADLGGGEYSRVKWLVPAGAPILVAGGGTGLATAISNRPVAPATVIQITDSASYVLTADITLATGEALTIQAADGVQPHVRLGTGSIGIQAVDPDASLTLGGLLIEGGLQVKGDLRGVRLLHTTLVPGRSVEQEVNSPPVGPSLVVDPGPPTARLNTQLEVLVASSIVGALRIPAHAKRLVLLDSIVAGVLTPGGPPVAAVSDATDTSGPPAHIERSTLLGSSRFISLELGSESIFSGRVLVERRQGGCLRFSYVPPGSETPQQYRCQPALEVSTQTEAREHEAAKAGISLPPGWKAALATQIESWLVPAFESGDYGDPGFAQLRRTCPMQIRTGAEDGSEMGSFCQLKQPQREANLRVRLDEYLPIGLEAGLVYVT